jgi:hypothetical protein
MAVNYVKHEKIDMKNYPELNEEWIMDIIREEPSVLDLGDLTFHDKSQRFEMNLQNRDNMFEVKIQLGETDYSLLLGAIEFWGYERKNSPQYKHHYAVIVAENITDSFLSAINLYKGLIPFIIIQMSAVKIGDNISLVFTKILDWEDKEPRQTAVTADEILKFNQISSVGFFQDCIKIMTGKINKLNFEKDDDCLRTQFFEYYDFIDILRFSFDYRLYETLTFREFRKRVDECIPLVMDKELKVVKKVIDEWDPFHFFLLGAPDDEYEPEIRDIVLRLKRKDTVKDIANIVSSVFIKWFGDFDKFHGEPCMNIAKKIKEGIEEIQKAQ